MIEFETLVLGMDKPNASCCIVRTTQQIIWLKFCMMKSVIRSQSDGETKAAFQIWEELYIKNNMQYIEPHLRKAKVKEAPKRVEERTELIIEESKGPAPEPVEEEEVDTEDYTKAVDLKKLFSLHEKPANHIIAREELIGLNCNDFFDLYLADNAKHSQASFYERKGEKEVSCENWTDP